MGSALVHSFASLYARHEDSGELVFFMSEGLMVIIEEVVMALGRACGIKGKSSLWKWVGYIWTFIGFVIPAMRAVAGQANSGMWAHPDVPYSIMAKVKDHLVATA